MTCNKLVCDYSKTFLNFAYCFGCSFLSFFVARYHRLESALHPILSYATCLTCRQLYITTILLLYFIASWSVFLMLLVQHPFLSKSLKFSILFVIHYNFIILLLSFILSIHLISSTSTKATQFLQLG